MTQQQRITRLVASRNFTPVVYHGTKPSYRPWKTVKGDDKFEQVGSLLILVAIWGCIMVGLYLV